MTYPEASEFMFRDEQKTVAGALEFFEQIVASYATETPYFVYAIRMQGIDAFIGTCGASGLPYDGIYELFCCILPGHRLQGYAAEASKALLDYCFAHHEVSEFRAYVNLKNPCGPGLAARLGMRHLGAGEHPVYGDESNVYALRKGEEVTI